MLMCAYLYSQPRMWIGTFAINDYTGNGGGASNLPYAIEMADNFAAAAVTYVRPYNSQVCH